MTFVSCWEFLRMDMIGHCIVHMDVFGRNEYSKCDLD